LVAPEGVEQVELTEPWRAVEESGGTPELVSTEVGKVQAFNHLTPADTFEADKAARRCLLVRLRRAGAARRGGQPRLPARQRRRRRIRQGVLGRGQAGCGDLSRTFATPAPIGWMRRWSNARAGQAR